MASLRALEWVFLLVGLLALDCFVWVNTSSVLYQAYEDWAFDQTLRGLTPSVGRVRQRRSALVVWRDAGEGRDGRSAKIHAARQ